MATPVIQRPLGKKYLGNSATRELHDLHNEQFSCEIEALIEQRTAVIFSPDTLCQAREDGYERKHICIQRVAPALDD